MAFFIIAAAEGSILLTKTFRNPALFHDGMEVVWRLLDGYKPFFHEDENRIANKDR
jgi:hypothetical protein